MSQYIADFPVSRKPGLPSICSTGMNTQEGSRERKAESYALPAKLPAQYPLSSPTLLACNSRFIEPLRKPHTTFQLRRQWRNIGMSTDAALKVSKSVLA